LPASFTATLATVHKLDWRAAGFEFLGVPRPGPDFARREIAKWRELIAVSEHPPEPILTDLIAWLEANAPATNRVTLVHGAYRTGNLLIHDDRISAVLDWEHEDACRYYSALYAMRSVAFWMSASGLYATGKSDDIRLAGTAWSVPVVLARAARELGY
jgi:hypothetical protein